MSISPTIQFEKNKTKIIDDISQSLDLLFCEIVNAPQVTENVDKTERYIEITDDLLRSIESRFFLHSYKFDESALFEAVSLMSQRINSLLSMTNLLFKKGSSGSLNDKNKFYCFDIVRQEINDMSVAIKAYKKLSKSENGKDINEENKAFCSIASSLERAAEMITLLCDQFAGDEVVPLKNKQICGIIKSIKKEVASIKKETRSFHIAAKLQP